MLDTASRSWLRGVYGGQTNPLLQSSGGLLRHKFHALGPYKRLACDLPCTARTEELANAESQELKAKVSALPACSGGRCHCLIKENTVEKMIVAVFDNEPKALEGLQTFRDLDREGHISLYDVQMVAKEPSGAVRVIDYPDISSFAMPAGGTAVGALVGLLGGPVTAVLGGAAGLLLGTIGGLEETGVTDEFVSDVKAALTPGKAAVVADVAEEWETPVDTELEHAGGVVYRRTLALIETTQDDRDAAAHRAEMDQLKAERAKAKSERLAKIDAKIDNLRAKLEGAIERKRAKMQLREQQREAKIQALKSKADQAQGEVRKRQEARIAELRRDYAEKVNLG